MATCAVGQRPIREIWEISVICLQVVSNQASAVVQLAEKPRAYWLGHFKAPSTAGTLAPRPANRHAVEAYWRPYEKPTSS
jgi:hypothetical protein